MLFCKFCSISEGYVEQGCYLDLGKYVLKVCSTDLHNV
jgi:hypothetical protein